MCPLLVWHRCWCQQCSGPAGSHPLGVSTLGCHQSSEPTVTTLSGTGPRGHLGTPPPPGFPLAPSSRADPIPSPEAAPGDPQPRPSPSPTRGVDSVRQRRGQRCHLGLALGCSAKGWGGTRGLEKEISLLPRAVWGQIPAFLGWERAGKQPQALRSKESSGAAFFLVSSGISLCSPFAQALLELGGTLPPRCSHRHPHDVRASFPPSHPSRGDLAGWGPEAELAPGLQVGQIPPGAGFGRCPGPPSIRGPGTPCKTSPEPQPCFWGPFPIPFGDRTFFPGRAARLGMRDEDRRLPR